MISVIILTICALIDLYILLNTHEKVRTRKDRNQYWSMFPWVYKGRYKYPLYIWIIAILCCSGFIQLYFSLVHFLDVQLSRIRAISWH